jgi:anti-sigma-K factor RskA
MDPLPLDFTAVAEPSEPRRLPTWRNSLLAVAAALLIALSGGIAIDRLFLQNDDDSTNEMTIAFSLTPSTPMPDVSAQLTYDPDSQMFRLQTENMPSAPADHVYQVWLIDQAGVPQPKGVMDEPTFVVAADMHNYQAFAITVEPGPIGSDAPSTEPFFVAPLDESTTS